MLCLSYICLTYVENLECTRARGTAGRGESEPKKPHVFHSLVRQDPWWLEPDSHSCSGNAQATILLGTRVHNFFPSANTCCSTLPTPDKTLAQRQEGMETICSIRYICDIYIYIYIYWYVFGFLVEIIVLNINLLGK